jgi:hypothetical protein
VNYRNLQAEAESFKQPLSVVKSKLSFRLDLLKNRITKYALQKVESELIKSLSLTSNEEYLDSCDCIMRFVYRLPCKHQLLSAPETIPLEFVHSRWHIQYHDGRGMCRFNK